jgi:hypothetical protein
MKKMTRLTTPATPKRHAKPGRTKAVLWSADRLAALRKPVSFPTGGDCNCGGK